MPSKRITLYLLILARVTGATETNAKVILPKRGREREEEEIGTRYGAIVTLRWLAG